MTLPVYEHKATPEQKIAKIEFLKFQVEMIKEQESWGMGVSRISVKCGCHKKIRLLDSYRCLYCGVWYCKECAEEHFGMRVE